MPRARVDEFYDERHKIREAWRTMPLAVGLHIMAITYTSRHELDGRLPDAWLKDILPQRRQRESVLRSMVEHGLFDVDGTGYSVHDYLDWNPSASDREQRRSSARGAAQARWNAGNGSQKHAKRMR